jgi:hypothetical protein
MLQGFYDALWQNRVKMDDAGCDDETRRCADQRVRVSSSKFSRQHNAFK